MLKKAIPFVLILFLSTQAFAADETNPTQPIKLSISNEQIQEVKRIEALFITDLGKQVEDYEFVIEESEVLNAYATLGKKIVITTGIIKKLKSEAALAFVIAHELGHVEKKHVILGIFREGIGGLIQMIFFREASTAGTIYRGANYMHGKYYSRSKEKKADLFAVELINKFYCKVPGKLEFFEGLSQEIKSSKASEYFSTHPLPESRIAYLHVEIEKAGCVL